MKIQILTALFYFSFISAYGQKICIHSHNDYQQTVPFWDAYSNGLNSIEADVFMRNDTLYVTHDEQDIQPERTLESLYLNPIRQAKALKLRVGQEIQLLIDLKSEGIGTLNRIIEVLAKYTDLTQDKNLKFVISGNRPAVEQYVNYPDYIYFDYQSLEPVKDVATLQKIGLISLSFRNFSQWNGKGRLTHQDFELVQSAIARAHMLGKPFRFWATPDSKTAWKAFYDMGVDFINTDRPWAASNYLKLLPNQVYSNQLTSDVYLPTYKVDQKNLPVRNIILLIGDGNGLTQISAATLANGGALTLTQLKSIGLIKTQSADDFTTDSAAAATALATGEKTNNRAIGVDSLDGPIANLAEILHDAGFSTGIITSDEITGATPASFYAHRKDRSDSEGILQDLKQSNLNVIAGGGGSYAEEVLKDLGFVELDNLLNKRNQKSRKVYSFFSDKGVPASMKGRANALAETTQKTLQLFESFKDPFFLMIEGAQIDSYGHENETWGIVTEGIDFDRAITEAIKFADTSENTLVIITADHETSGFSIPQGNLKNRSIEGDFTTDDHTGVMVPVFAYGPQSHLFQGVYENNLIFTKIIEALKIKDKF